MKRREKESEESLPLRNLAHPFLKALRKMCKYMEITFIIFIDFISILILGYKWLTCLRCDTSGKAMKRRKKVKFNFKKYNSNALPL